jgi:DNA-binding FadR family transcriptional regulator
MGDVHLLARRESLEDAEAVSRLRAFVAEKGLKSGARLPAERELTDQLGMTRNTLRKALESLEREGAIWRHVGKGTFVSQPAENPELKGTLLTSTLLGHISQQMTPFRMMRARFAIEPAIAKEAAINASSAALNHMKLAVERTRSAPTWQAYEIQDDIFHRAIAEASDNLLLLALHDQLNLVRRAVAWGNVTRKNVKPPADHSSFAEHERIADAICARDPNAAYEAMSNHLHSVSKRLFGGT